DTEFRDVMVRELRELHNRIRATTIYVTHDQLEAMAMADRIAVMNHGVIEQFGTPQEIYSRPASLFVADFIGSPSMNFIDFSAGIASGAQSVRIGEAEVGVPQLREDVAPSGLVLGVRPEDVSIDDDAPLRGAVYESEYLGTTQIVAVEFGATLVKARVPATRSFRPGEPVGMRFDAARLSLFRRDGGKAIRTALHDGGAHG
ncbi:MAG TPA: ABC transporter ATP-binding protein, partial [Rhizobiaceae bacterium]|nr:ABC transporter ATP-binding protein [Rhizobiaceae bacterium]